MLGGNKQNLVCLRTKERNSDSHKDWARPACECLRVSCQGTGQQCPATGTRLWQQQSWEAQWAAWVLLEEITISPTLVPLSRWPTDSRAIIPKKFLHCCGSSSARNKFPNLGIQQMDWEPPRNLTSKVNGFCLQNFHRTGEIHFWRAQTKPCVHQDPGERRSRPPPPQETELDLPVSVLESLVEAWVNTGLLQGQRHWL